MDDEFYHLYGDEDYDHSFADSMYEPKDSVSTGSNSDKIKDKVKYTNNHPYWCKCQRLCGGDQ